MKKLTILLLIFIISATSYAQDDDWDYYLYASFATGIGFPDDGSGDTSFPLTVELDFSKRLGYTTNLSLGLMYWFNISNAEGIVPGHGGGTLGGYESTSGFRVPLRFMKVFSKGVNKEGSRSKVPEGFTISLGGYFGFGTRELINEETIGLVDGPTNQTNFGGVFGIGYGTRSYGSFILEVQTDFTTYSQINYVEPLHTMVFARWMIPIADL